MAIERTVLMSDGSVRSHHEVERITHIIGERTIIDVLSWTDQSKDGTAIRTFVERDYDSTLDEQDAYDEVSADELFAEYVDPAQEALDDLIPSLTDEQAELIPTVWREWAAGTAYAVGDRVRRGTVLYRCVQAHTAQEGYEPEATPALWTRTTPQGVINEWVQPTGVQDAYSVGDKVRHAEKVWVSFVDANVWEPGVYGWEETME